MGLIVPPPFDAPQAQWDAYVRYHERQRKFLLVILVITALVLLAFALMLFVRSSS